jgi:hypothetical protein
MKRYIRLYEPIILLGYHVSLQTIYMRMSTVILSPLLMLIYGRNMEQFFILQLLLTRGNLSVICIALHLYYWSTSNHKVGKKLTSNIFHFLGCDSYPNIIMRLGWHYVRRQCRHARTSSARSGHVVSAHHTLWCHDHSHADMILSLANMFLLFPSEESP